jgi:ATP-dependent DNA helicase RecQ
MPGSLESYYKESGRAGSDGSTASCLLLYKLEDRRTHQFFSGCKYPGADAVQAVCDAPDEEVEVPGVAKTKVRSIRAMMRQLRTRDAERISQEYAVRREADRTKLDSMSSYAQSALCRWKLLLAHFNEADGFDACGTCDNCRVPLELRLQAS